MYPPPPQISSALASYQIWGGSLPASLREYPTPLRAFCMRNLQRRSMGDDGLPPPRQRRRRLARAREGQHSAARPSTCAVCVCETLRARPWREAGRRCTRGVTMHRRVSRLHTHSRSGGWPARWAQRRSPTQPQHGFGPLACASPGAAPQPSTAAAGLGSLLAGRSAAPQLIEQHTRGGEADGVRAVEVGGGLDLGHWRRIAGP